MNTVMLRKWKDADQEPYAAMNADPEVMRYFPATLSKAAARESFLRLRTTLDERGWGVWANGVVR